MSLYAFQLKIKLSLDIPAGLGPITGFLFHYVNTSIPGQTTIDPSLGSDWYSGVQSDFYAAAVVGTAPIPNQNNSWCTDLGNGHYEMELTQVPIDTPTGPPTPEPYLRGGEYFLSSVQIDTLHGTEYLLPPFAGVNLQNVVIPDRTKTSTRAIKITSLAVTLEPEAVP
jgi:hypothetical protein